MGVLLAPRREEECWRDTWSNRTECGHRSSWYDWGRWAAFAIIVGAALIVFFLLACFNARRRRRRGLAPHIGTNWMAPPPGPPPPNQPFYGDPYYPSQPPPQYSPPNAQNYGQNYGYFGGMQPGIELQQPPNAYHPQSGEPMYPPPAGPPPGAKTIRVEEIIRPIASMSPVDKPFWARDALSDLKSAPQTLSSWDSCMAKSYCKWPVIVAIIVGAVIIIAILACIINCLCCGIQCCRGCCSCLSCCCPSPRNKSSRNKYMDDPSPYHQPPPPMPVNTYQPPPGPPTYRGAQIARFDSPSSPAPSKGKSMNEDALPEMPTWDNARTRRIEDNSSPRPEDMEMEPLNPAAQEPRRSPVPRTNTGFMGPPPARVGTASSYYPESRVPDDQSIYARRSPGPASPPAAVPPLSPYDEPYGDYSYGMTPTPAPYTSPQYNQMPTAMSPAPAAYAPQQYTPMPSAIPAGETPYRQPSPGPNFPFRQPSPGPNFPFRQPSPGPNFPFRQPSPGPNVPLRQPSPGMGIGVGVPYRQPSPGLTQPPSYRGMSPTPTSPPPPFSAMSPAPVLETNNDPGRPPSLLQSGRKPAPNSFRDV